MMRKIVLFNILLLIIMQCISIPTFLDSFQTSNSNQTDLNEQLKRQQDKERIKQSYETQKNIDSQKEKDCKEITKKYMKNEINYIISDCK